MRIKFMGISCEIAPRWLSQNKSALPGALRQQAITWTDVKPDLCNHRASLGHTELQTRGSLIYIQCWAINFIYNFAMGVNHTFQIDGLVQERCNSIVNTLELCLSCIDPSKWSLGMNGIYNKRITRYTSCHVWCYLIHSIYHLKHSIKAPQITRFMGPTWGPPGSCRPQMGPMLTPWTLLSGSICNYPVSTVPADGLILIGASLIKLVVSMRTKPSLNSSPPGQNVRHFADDIFRCIFLN